MNPTLRQYHSRRLARSFFAFQICRARGRGWFVSLCAGMFGLWLAAMPYVADKDRAILRADESKRWLVVYEFALEQKIQTRDVYRHPWSLAMSNEDKEEMTARFTRLLDEANRRSIR